MRARRQPVGPGPKDYRNGAIGVVALALVAGGLISGNAPEPGPAPQATHLRSEHPARPASAFAMSADDQPDSSPEPAATPALPAPPPVPGLASAGAALNQKAAPAQPGPAQIEQLIAASRARSGGVEQGDDGRP